ncbi:MAG: UvrD-helicase domain-containing protein [Clostridia bacterium]|nr:UvrD-helicase domain-containing protein [Clostridia bacterium]
MALADKILEDVLSENSDARLKNIVSTIQREQNQIIRANMFKPIIVQGCAGSGKTTVALHRIAYLVYTYEKEFKPEDFLIIGPNKFFLNYISNVLPDLGVDYVRQETFEEFGRSFIRDKIHIESGNFNLQKLVDGKEDNTGLVSITKFKSSLRWKDYLDEALKNYNETYLPKQDFILDEKIAILYEDLQKIFLDGMERIPLEDRVKRLKEYMIHKTSEYYKKEISDYIKSLGKINLTKIYQRMINSSDLARYTEYASLIQEDFNKRFAKKTVQYEDLAPLMYLRFRLSSPQERFQLKHIIIDEAQDFGEFQFVTLYEILNRNKSMTILGDLAQGIYMYRGTENWQRINDVVFHNEAQILYLEKSYRTTSNIMNEANQVLSKMKDKIGVKLGVPVSRKGSVPEYKKVQSFDEKIKVIREFIQDFKRRGFQNIGIISRTSQASQEIYEGLKEENAELILENMEQFKGGITVVSSYYSKGLEFDCVIITDYEKYQDNLLDNKLLYIAMTRSMHELKMISL